MKSRDDGGKCIKEERKRGKEEEDRRGRGEKNGRRFEGEAKQKWEKKIQPR